MTSSSWRVLTGAAIAAVVALESSPAEANGRFPESNQIQFSAQDPDLILLRVTFGLLVSHDRGKTFDWVCEQSIGFSGVEDPMYTITPSKNYIGTTFQGLTISRDQACGWSFTPGDLENQVFIDLSADPNDAKKVVTFASSYDQQDDAGNILFTSKIWETVDEGASFQQLGQKLDPALLGYTVDLTKTDPNRIYITAVRNPGVQPSAFLLTSRNHGTSWEEQQIPLEGTERSVYVAGVDPNDAERVYLRTSASVDKPTRLLVREALDGGPATIRTIHQAVGPLLGFALTADGSKVFIGGPKDGVKVANKADYAFVQKSTLEVACLAVSDDGLWACSNEQNGFIAARSTDEGATFTGNQVHFCDIRGPLLCPQGSGTSEKCTSIWPQQKALLGCGGDVDGGPNSSSGSLDGSFESGVGFEPTTSPSKGCDCNQVAPAGPWGALLTVSGAALALIRRARRQKKS